MAITTLKKIQKECNEDIYKPLLKALIRPYREVVRNSLYAEYSYQEQRYHYTYGRENSKNIKQKLLKIATKLNDNDIFERYYRLPLPPSRELGVPMLCPLLERQRVAILALILEMQGGIFSLDSREAVGGQHPFKF